MKKEAKENIDNLIKLILELWKYGIHEYTYNFLFNYGFIIKGAILVDLFEITNDKEIVIKHIKKQKWNRNGNVRKNLQKEMYNYLIKQCDKKLILENFDNLWNIAKE